MKDNEFIEINIEVGQLKAIVNQLYTAGKIKKASNGKVYVNLQIAKTKERKFEKSLSVSIRDAETKEKHYVGAGNFKVFENGKVSDINLHAATAQTAPTPTAPVYNAVPISTTAPMNKPVQQAAFDVPPIEQYEDDLPF
jgi:hypothetical protein